jgi:hypothetical protein
VDKTKRILIEAQDLGRRLMGISTDLPPDEAITELQLCDCQLEDLITVLMGIDDDDTDGNAQ